MRARIARAGLTDRIRGVQDADDPLPFADGEFDVVFSKDSLVQIPDKPAIFAEVLRVLRPGGRFIASDWLRGGSAEHSAEMLEFFRLEGIAYNMATRRERGRLARAGFEGVEIRDRHDWYLTLAQRELEAMEGDLNAIIVHRIGPQRARHFIDNWRQLIVVLKRGELRPGHLKAAARVTAECFRSAAISRSARSPAPRHGTLVHGEDGIDDEVFSFHGLRDFIHQLRVIERAVIVQCQRVARVKQPALRKIPHVLPFG